MFKKFLIIMPFNLPWDWSADYQKQTCLVLNKQNLVIAYIHQSAHFWLKPRKYVYPKIHNIIFYTPKYIIPFRRFSLIEKLNQYLCLIWLKLRYGINKKTILWIFDPVFYYFLHIKKVCPYTVSIYDCVDYIWSRVNQERQNIQKMEKILIRKVDYFFVNSYALARLHRTIRHPNAVVPQGFRMNDFLKCTQKDYHFPKNKKVIGYVGAINHRLDFNLLFSLIRRNPQWYFVLWGKVQETDINDVVITNKNMNRLKTLPNIAVGTSIDRREIPYIIRHFDIGIIPYRVDYDANLYCYPMKLFEYFYIGKPVVSTSIEELKRFPKYVKIVKTVDGWEKHIKNLLSKSWPEKYKTEQYQLAIDNSWQKKISAIMCIIGIESG